MDKRIFIIIFIIFIVLASAFVIYNQTHVKVGEYYFEVPNGYDVINNDSFINLTNNQRFICLKCYNNDSADMLVKNYVHIKEAKNFSVDISNYDLDGVNVTKTDINGRNVTQHYWFNLNGKTYEFFKEEGDFNADYIVYDLIKSRTKLFV